MQNLSVYSPFLTNYPSEVLQKSVIDIVNTLYQAYGDAIYPAFDDTQTIISPLSYKQNTIWLKSANCIGVNVRTIGSFWNILPYSMTFPAAQNAIHILPIWEPGVVASLYGMSSWNINPEFYSAELARVFPTLNTVEKQLKVVINLLHLTGRVVGMDVVPHTDRYAEQVLANPRYFEWLQREDTRIVDHRSNAWQKAASLIFEALVQMGAATPGQALPPDAGSFFDETTETERLLLLFGPVSDYSGRLARRKIFIQWLYEHGFETVPATMAPPYRGIEVDPDPGASVYDEEGRLWRDYRMTHPRGMSRVFGPLARYRLYESLDDNKDWALDFDRPVEGAWEYVCEHYYQIQAQYNFDFMRGDMSHVQMRPSGVPDQPDAWYDLLGSVKQRVLTEKPWFGYFAESFMAPPGEMAYGDEYDHLEASYADSTLGDLQSEPVGTSQFVKTFARYYEVGLSRSFVPNFTIMTADKDDPRFDSFYLTGNEIRYFIALFFNGMPSYMGLGFECRDPHPVPAENEYYTKLYVFQLQQGPKATSGPYKWGHNRPLYEQLVRQKLVSEQLSAVIGHLSSEWVLPPDEQGQQKYIIWKTGAYLFIANLDTEKESPLIPLANWGLEAYVSPYFSTNNPDNKVVNGNILLSAGEGVILCVP